MTKGLLKPFKWMVQTTNEFNILEPDLLPLLDHIEIKPSFYIDPKDLDFKFLPKIALQKKLVLDLIEFSYIQPNIILE